MEKICFIAINHGDSGLIDAINTIKILSNVSNKLYVVTNYNLNASNKKISIIYFINSINKINFILNDIYILIKTLKVVSKCNKYIMGMGGESLILTPLVLRLFNKKTYLILTGNPLNPIYKKNPLVYNLRYLKNKAVLKIYNIIIAYSSNVVKERNLYKNRKKIRFVTNNYVKITKSSKYSKRDNNITFVGRLTKDKGIINFIKTAKKLKNDYNFVICGDGKLKKQVINFIRNNNLTNTCYLGWVNRKQLIKVYNNTKILLMPSYSEGLPKAILEAMSYSIPIIGTKVGSMNDIIINNYNGYKLNNNNPEHISITIKKLFNSCMLDEMSENAKKYVTINYSFKVIINKWYSILYT